MGIRLDVTCRSCGHVSDQIDGAIMSGFNLRCDQCGRTTLVTIAELIDTDPPEVDKAGAEAWRLRRARLPVLAGRCDCGGRFGERTPIRCPACHSTDVAKRTRAILD